MPSHSSNVTRVERLNATTQAAARAYLDRSPILNVFLSYVVGADISAVDHRNVLVARDDDAVSGVLYCGRQIVIAAEPHAVAALAPSIARRAPVRMIVGERSVIAALWPLVSSRAGTPRLVRRRQLVMVVSRSTLVEHRGGVTVRHAVLHEAREVADSSASMIAHELGSDPRRDTPSFDAGVRQMIERKLWWVGESSGRLCFFCNVGPWSNRTAQLQGIWTPPELRGQGLATASLGAICSRLLETFPTVSLYVNDFNEPAIALYRRIGFEHAGDFTTILF